MYILQLLANMFIDNLPSRIWKHPFIIWIYFKILII